MLYSRCNLVSAEERRIIPSLTLLVALLLAQPRMLLAIPAARVRCWLRLNWLHTKTPGRAVPQAVRPQPGWLTRTLPSQFHIAPVGTFLLPAVAPLNGSPALRQDSSAQFGPVCYLQIWGMPCITSSGSLMKMLNRTGLRTGPCSTRYYPPRRVQSINHERLSPIIQPPF